MNYHELSLPDLKVLARDRVPKIKNYYIMKKAQLIQYLLMSDLPEKMIIEKKTLKTLQEEAKAKGIPKVWKMRRAELLEVLYPDLFKTDLKTDKQETVNKKWTQPDLSEEQS
jgi:hypothetical protein